MKARPPYLLGQIILLGLVVAGCELMPSPSVPPVTVVPSHGVVSSRVTIVGAGFGSTQGTGYATFGGKAAAILSWSDTSITARVPLLPTPNAEANAVQVSVVVGGNTVGSGSFTAVRGILYCAKRGPKQVICLANPDGGESFDLTVDGASGYPQWSPDGTKVAFVRGGGSAYAGDIYVVHADGTSETRLTNTGDNATPAWSPNGSRLVFSSSRDGNGEIYVMDADGFGQTNLSHYSGSDWFPSWSPDGKRIAFNRNVAVHPVDYRVFIMDADGSDQTDISPAPTSGRDWCAVWSPDGSKLLFQRYEAGNYELYTMRPDGSNPKNLTVAPEPDAQPAWSPDGSRIAYVSFRGNDPEIFVMNADGSGQLRLTDSPGWDSNPAWSPDGTQLVFESSREGDGHVYVMGVDGRDVRRLTADVSFWPTWTTRYWPSSLP